MRALLAIDLLDPQLDTLTAQAIAHAERLACTLDVLYVESMPYLDGFIADVTVASLLEQEAAVMRKAHTDKLEALVQGLPEAIRGEAITVLDKPPEIAITEACVDYDLLIVGTHGRTGLKHFMLGSVAERVVRKATVPTLVLREGADG